MFPILPPHIIKKQLSSLFFFSFDTGHQRISTTVFVTVKQGVVTNTYLPLRVIQ